MRRGRAEWAADLEAFDGEGSRVDTFTIEGKHAEGAATFVGSAGESRKPVGGPVSAAFAQAVRHRGFSRGNFWVEWAGK